ncbi:MAG: YIP1 family protein [Prevotella sp.]|jgi:hypothetical protein|nr:YIP1 family protein [Prevotella sp.]
MESLVNRIKNILLSPKTEWVSIEQENTPWLKTLTSYLLLAAAIPTVAAFIGYGVIGSSAFGIRYHSIEWGIRMAAVQYVLMVGGVFVTSAIIYLLADSFLSKKDYNSAFALVAWSYAPMCIAGIFYIFPALSWLASLAGLYGLYLLYIGLKPMLKTPDDKQTTYFVVSLICTIGVSIALSAILTVVLVKGMYSF